MKGEGYYEKFNPLTGFVSSNKLPFDSASALKAYREQFEHEQSEPSASDKFLNQLSVLQKKGFNIVLLRMPVTHSMRILEDRYTNHLCDTLMRRAERQGVYLINVQDLKIESYDGSHLSSQSAARVTWSIGEAIHRLPLDYDADKR
jgi:hypothetical protein